LTIENYKLKILIANRHIALCTFVSSLCTPAYRQAGLCNSYTTKNTKLSSTKYNLTIKKLQE